jgi:hypothetical protein
MTSVSPSSLSQWTIQDLDPLLAQQEWQAADAVTLSLLLEAVGRGNEGWLDAAAIAQIPCDLLHQIDQRWMQASDQHFGFSIQAQIYEAQQGEAFNFSRQVGWTLFQVPVRLLGFHKFYDFLNFSLEAPVGHLPARWFWQLSWRESLRVGGFGAGRGAAYGDANMLDAMMLRLERCRRV